MKLENKILLFLSFALIYSSVIYLIGQKQETEIELDISNSLLNDFINQKYSDGTYKQDYVMTGYKEIDNISFPDYKYIETNKHILISNQSLNGTTHIKLKLPINIADVIVAYIKNYN